jgi:hypothetical protein
LPDKKLGKEFVVMENNQSVNTEDTTTEIPSTEKVKADASEVVDKAKSMEGSSSKRERAQPRVRRRK